MNKPVISFLVMAVIGAVVAFGVRTALHEPYAAATDAAVAITVPVPPAAASVPATPVGHAASAAPTGGAPAASEDRTPVNTICALCGMKVDPSIPPANYQGKWIGFGCRACPPKFAADPDRYAPAALRNEEAE